MAVELDGKVKSPSTLAHVVFRTSNIQKMAAFYKTFLGGDITFQNDQICFIRYDVEHHRVAIVAIPDLGPRIHMAAGLEHVAFGFDTLEDLLLAYNQRKARGILPTWCINHGPTTSIYYNDPDGNRIETQVDNFDTAEEANAFMTSKYFAENPIGTDFEPEELERRLNSGEDQRSIKRRVEIGQRGLPEGF